MLQKWKLSQKDDIELSLFGLNLGAKRDCYNYFFTGNLLSFLGYKKLFKGNFEYIVIN